MTQVELAADESIEIVFLLGRAVTGSCGELVSVIGLRICRNFRRREAIMVQNTQEIQVKHRTELDLMLNGWLLYQT